MNIIEYSIRLGKALNKTELGKEIKNIYVSLRDEHNKHGEKVVSHYQIYNQCVEHECSRNHFYGWSITYEKMKQYVPLLFSHSLKSPGLAFTISRCWRVTS